MGTAIKVLDCNFYSNIGTVTIKEETFPIVGLSISGVSSMPESMSSSQLQVIYNPSNTTQKGVSWQSSNTNVLSVDSSGLVTVANRPSADTQVTITVTSIANTSIKATHTITVAAASETFPIVGLSISGVSSMPESMSSSQLQVIYNPSNTTQKGVSWQSSNTNVLSVDSSGLVTVANRPSADTQVTITVTSIANTSIKATHTITVAAASSSGYTTRGLYAYFDGTQNAGKGKTGATGQISSISTWTDIINAISLTATAGYTNSGFFTTKAYDLSSFSDASNNGFTSVSGGKWPFAETAAGDFALEVIMKLPTTFIDGNTGFSSGVSDDGGVRFQVGITPTGLVKLNYRYSDGSWSEQYFSGAKVSGGQFVSILISRSSGVLTLYINGVTAGSAITFTEKITTSVSTWSIAANGQPAIYYGYRFYKNALTAAEVKANSDYNTKLYNS